MEVQSDRVLAQREMEVRAFPPRLHRKPMLNYAFFAMTIEEDQENSCGKCNQL